MGEKRILKLVDIWKGEGKGGKLLKCRNIFLILVMEGEEIWERE